MAKCDTTELRILAQDVLKVRGSAAPVSDNENQIGFDRLAFDLPPETCRLIPACRLLKQRDETYPYSPRQEPCVAAVPRQESAQVPKGTRRERMQDGVAEPRIHGLQSSLTRTALVSWRLLLTLGYLKPHEPQLDPRGA
jgi:hypothetical protein